MMRHPFAQVVVPVVAILLAAATVVAAPRSTNLLANPDFEQSLDGHPWMPTGWDTSAAEVGGAFFGRDTFLVEHGRYAVGLANVSMLYPMAHNWSQAIRVGKEAWGKDAVFTAWTRSNGLQGRGFLLLQAYRDTVTRMSLIWKVPRLEAAKRMRVNPVDDPLIDFGWRRQYFSESETGWVKRTVRVFVPPTVDVIWVRLGILGTGQVLFDDASLTLEAPERPAPLPIGTNLLKDPGFEGDGNDWEYSLPPFANMQVVRDSTVAHTGRASVRMEGGLDGMIKVKTGIGQAFPRHDLAGKRVRATTYIRTDSLRGLAYIQIYVHTLHGGELQPGKQYSSNTPWELATSEMDIPEDAYEVWVWFVYNAPAEGRLYYDDCTFEVLGPASKPPRAGRR